MPSILVGSNNLSDCKIGSTSVSIQLGSTEYFTPGGSGGPPSWWTSAMENSFQSAMNNIVSQIPSYDTSDYYMDQYIDIASLDANNKVFVTRLYRGRTETSRGYVEETICGNSTVIGFEDYADPDTGGWSELAVGMYYDTNSSAWISTDFYGNVLDHNNTLHTNVHIVLGYNEDSLPYLGSWNSFDVGCLWPAAYGGDNFEFIFAQKIDNQYQQFVCYSNVPYNTPSLLPVNTPVTTS